MPPSTPSMGLKVFRAAAAPSGTEITADSPAEYPVSAQTASIAARIICRGTVLIAAAPTG